MPRVSHRIPQVKEGLLLGRIDSVLLKSFHLQTWFYSALLPELDILI